MTKIKIRLAKLEAELNPPKGAPLLGIWLVGVNPDHSSRLGRFLSIGRTEDERKKNRVAAYKIAALEWVSTAI